jgi:hypothetical protein
MDPTQQPVLSITDIAALFRVSNSQAYVYVSQPASRRCSDTGAPQVADHGRPGLHQRSPPSSLHPAAAAQPTSGRHARNAITVRTPEGRAVKPGAHRAPRRSR